MITRQELEKMVEDEAYKHAGWKNIPSSSLTDSIKYHFTMLEKSFKSGASFVSDRLWRKIETMKAENQRMREALEFIKNGCLVPPDGGSPSIDDYMKAAHRALTPPKESEAGNE